MSKAKRVMRLHVDVAHAAVQTENTSLDWTLNLAPDDIPQRRVHEGCPITGRRETSGLREEGGKAAWPLQVWQMEAHVSHIVCTIGGEMASTISGFMQSE